MANTFTFPFENKTIKTNGKKYFAYIDEAGKTHQLKGTEYETVKAYFENMQAPTDNKGEGTPEPKDDPKDDKGAPEPKTEKKVKGHATADKFLALIPKDTYIFRTNNKGHILITKADGDKTAYARIRPLKDGAWVFPGKELKATRSDWEYHKGWANEYALKVANWDEVAKVLNLA